MRNLLSVIFFVYRRIRARVFLATILVGIATLHFGIMPVHAQANPQQNVEAVATAAGVDQTTDLPTIIGRIIKIALGLVGVVFLCLILYAGYTYMTAAGDAAKVKRALDVIKSALIGLVVIALAWTITNYILGFFAGGGMGEVFAPKKYGPGTPLPYQRGASCLGQLIDMQLPAPGESGIARNSPIIVTFKNPIRETSLMKDWTVEALEAAFRCLAATRGEKVGPIIHTTRLAVTGRTAGPGLFETLAVLGWERVLARLERAKRHLG